MSRINAGLGRQVRRFLEPPSHVAGHSALPRRFEDAAAFAGRHRRVMDTAVACGVLGLGLLSHHVAAGRSSAFVLFTALLALPLAWRRRTPIAVFGFIAAVAFAQWMDHLPLLADIALFISIYSIAVVRPLRVAIAAAIVLEGGALLAAIRWSAGTSWLETFALLSAAVVAAVVSGVHVRARRLYVDGLLERAARLEIERDQQARLAAAAERARIAREMHDVIAHSLAVVISLANGATAKLRRDPEQSREALESISELGRRALEDTRQLLSVLRTGDGAEPRSLQPGIEQIVDLVDEAASTGLSATLTVHGDPAPVATGAALGAYRIVQEAITNTLKHAHDATGVAVAFDWTPQRLRIAIDDDGNPSAGPADPSDGFGLTGMRERAALYGGEATAGPRVGGGWTVSATIPTIPRASDE